MVLNGVVPEAVHAELEAAPWRKTNYYAPHEYIMSTWPGMDDLWHAMRLLIQEHGYDLRFRGKPWRYLDHAGYTYWTMARWSRPGEPRPEDTLRVGYVLNRKVSGVEDPADQHR